MMGNELQPVVGALYPLSATSDAHRRLEAGGEFGKIVLGDFHE
ncbi:zinc-binding dehydrogenase [Rhizobium laguerreae]|nr:zinc-binding dehydrogenase [Rhizobium laguerreae]